MTEAKNPPRQNKLGIQPIPRLLVNVSLPLMVSMMEKGTEFTADRKAKIEAAIAALS